VIGLGNIADAAPILDKVQLKLLELIVQDVVGVVVCNIVTIRTAIFCVTKSQIGKGTRHDTHEMLFQLGSNLGLGSSLKVRWKTECSGSSSLS
jgi:hypothetical protein